MLIGDPDSFAILMDVVPSWCSNGFVQGVFYIYVNSELYPNQLRTTTLSTDLICLLDKTSPFVIPKNNKELYLLETDELFKRLCELTFPEAEEAYNDYSYLIPLNEVQDAGYYFFVVAYEKEVRILVGKRNEAEDILFVDEIKLDIEAFEDIKNKVQNYYQNVILKAQLNA